MLGTSMKPGTADRMRSAAVVVGGIAALALGLAVVLVGIGLSGDSAGAVHSILVGLGVTIGSCALVGLALLVLRARRRGRIV